MDRIAAMCADAAVAAVVFGPLFFYLYRRRWHDFQKSAVYLLFALYLCGVYGAAGLPGFHSLTYRPRVNVTLFAYMFSDYRSSLLNVLFFLPLGFLLPMIWTRFRAGCKTVFFGFLTSALIEGIQLFTPRATDVNDLITNTLGAFLGWCLARLMQWIFPVMKPENDSRDVYWICTASVAVMFFVHPVLTGCFL